MDSLNLADAVSNEIVEVLKVTERKKEATKKKVSSQLFKRSDSR